MQLARDGQWAGALIYRQLTRSRAAAAARAGPSRWAMPSTTNRRRLTCCGGAPAFNHCATATP